MEDAFAVYILDRFEQLEHVELHLLHLQIFVPHQALIEVLLHQFKNKGELPFIV